MRLGRSKVFLMAKDRQVIFPMCLSRSGAERFATMLINVNAEYPIPIGVIEGSLPILNEENPYWVEGEMHSYDPTTFVFSNDENKHESIENYKKWFKEIK